MLPLPSVDRPSVLAIDIDGTMLRSDGTLSNRVINALHAAVDAGIHVVPSTGRPEVVAIDIIERSELDQYWIFSNGAVTRHLRRDELVRGFWIDTEMALDIMGELRSAIPGVRFAVEFAADLAYEAGFEDVVPNKPKIGPTDDLFGAVAAHGSPLQKVLVFDTNRGLSNLYETVGRIGDGRIVPTYSGLPFIELAAGDVTKATALDLLATDLDIERDRVWAVGDNYNDIDMLQWAGVGCVMGNASREIKQVADVELPSNDDDGVAVLIEHLLS